MSTNDQPEFFKQYGFLTLASFLSLLCLSVGVWLHELFHVPWSVPILIGLSFELFFVIPMHYMHSSFGKREAQLKAVEASLKAGNHAQTDEILAGVSKQLGQLSNSFHESLELSTLLGQVAEHVKEEVVGVKKRRDELLHELNDLAAS